MARYDGPIVDAHHHLWDLDLKRHPWRLTDAAAGIGAALGDISYMRKNYLAPDYWSDAAGQGVVAPGLHRGAQDRRRDPVEETLWFEACREARWRLPRPISSTPSRC